MLNYFIFYDIISDPCMVHMDAKNKDIDVLLHEKIKGLGFQHSLIGIIKINKKNIIQISQELLFLLIQRVQKLLNKVCDLKN